MIFFFFINDENLNFLKNICIFLISFYYKKQSTRDVVSATRSVYSSQAHVTTVLTSGFAAGWVLLLKFLGKNYIPCTLVIIFQDIFYFKTCENNIFIYFLKSIPDISY